MPVSHTPAVERIARVLAGYRLSVNGDGTDPHASRSVDMEWPDCVADALAVLRTLREPDPVMAAAGDADVWERMVLAAISAADAPSPA